MVNLIEKEWLFPAKRWPWLRFDAHKYIQKRMPINILAVRNCAIRAKPTLIDYFLWKKSRAGFSRLDDVDRLCICVLRPGWSGPELAASNQLRSAKITCSSPVLVLFNFATGTRESSFWDFISVADKFGTDIRLLISRSLIGTWLDFSCTLNLN
jgi:hypothetical protein